MNYRLLKISPKKEITYKHGAEGRALQSNSTENLKEESLKIPEEQEKTSQKELKDAYTPFQKLLLRIFGRIYIENMKKSGWSSPLPIYAFTCYKHGVQMAYPSGWNKTLYCPKCISEISTQFSMKHKTKT